MRTRMPLGRLRSARCTSMPHRTAWLGSANAIMNPSPWLFTTYPRWLFTYRRISLSCLPINRTHARSPMRSLSAVDSSMSENRIATLPSGASRARSGRSTSAQSARSSIEERTAAPNPSLRMMFAVCQRFLTASRPPESSMLRASTRRRSSSASRRARVSCTQSTTSATASRDGDGRKDVSGDLHPGHRSSIGCWSREAAKAPYYESRFIRANDPDGAPRAVDALDAAAAFGRRARRRLVGDALRPRRVRQPRAQAAASDRPVRLPVRRPGPRGSARPPSTTGRPVGRSPSRTDRRSGTCGSPRAPRLPSGC